MQTIYIKPLVKQRKKLIGKKACNAMKSIYFPTFLKHKMQSEIKLTKPSQW